MEKFSSWIDGVCRSYQHAWRGVVSEVRTMQMPGWHTPWLAALEWSVVVLGAVCLVIMMAWAWKQVRGPRY